MVYTFGIKTIKEIADKLNMSEVVLIEKTLDYFDDGAHKFESITVKDVMQFLKEAWFEYYISLCDDICTLKKLADEDIYEKKIEYDLCNFPKNDYTLIDERIKELNLKNPNKDTHTLDTNQNTNITIYVPTAEQARSLSNINNRQPQINTIINIVKPKIESAINNAIKLGRTATIITDLLADDIAEEINIANSYNKDDCIDALHIIRDILINKGYFVEIKNYTSPFTGKTESGFTVSWK